METQKASSGMGNAYTMQIAVSLSGAADKSLTCSSQAFHASRFQLSAKSASEKGVLESEILVHVFVFLCFVL